MHRSFLRLLTLTLLVLFAAPASAQYTRDAAANKKIDEAINTHYLATEFDKAESVLTGTIKACEDKCSPQTLAKAWMYVGIVRGSGRNDQNGAREAFSQAMALDPAVKLDSGLATPETQASFNSSGGGGAVETPSTPAAAGNSGGDAAGGNGLDCTPSVSEVETRRPIPVQCKSDEEVTSLELRYKAFGSETWKTVRMEHKGMSFRAQVPCDATQTAGTLKVYVQGKDVKGEVVSNWGNKNEPIEIQLVEQSTAEPPSYDDADPPARCAAKEICPPDFPGCDAGGGGAAAAGASCKSSSECKTGLLCIDGTCDTAPSCSTNSDCASGSCEDGKCTAGEGSGVIARKPKKIWVGFHVAQDWVLFGGEKPCLGDAKFACYLTNSSTQPYDTANFQTTDVGKISNGLVLATTRFLLSLDYAVIPSLTLGVRAGFAIGGGPPSGRKVEWDSPGGLTVVKVDDPGKSFLPFHAEVRAAYWFGKNALAKRGFRPYLQVGGGLAQVDAKVIVKVEDNGSEAARMQNPPTDTTADAWKKLGTVFLEGGGGVVYAFTPSFGLQLNLNAMMMLGSSGFALEPSLGAVVGL